MRCPNCGTGIEDGVVKCPQCEIAITWDGDTATFQMPGGLVPVYAVTDPAIQPVIESMLAANGIPFEVTDDVSQDFMSWGRMLAGYNPVTGPPLIRVPSEHEEAARELIASATTVPPEPDPDPEP